MRKQYIQWYNFLPENLVAILREAVLTNKEHFASSGVGAGTKEDPYLRRSMVLYAQHLDNFREPFDKLIRDNIPIVQDILESSFRYAPLGINMAFLELQVTASGDGHFYRVHVDDDIGTRIISFVYYFRMSEQPAFTGGALRLLTDDGDVFIEPEHNSIVWFLSNLDHEIMPVSVPSHEFMDGRFTCNGWLNMPWPTSIIQSSNAKTA